MGMSAIQIPEMNIDRPLEVLLAQLEAKGAPFMTRLDLWRHNCTLGQSGVFAPDYSTSSSAHGPGPRPCTGSVRRHAYAPIRAIEPSSLSSTG